MRRDPSSPSTGQTTANRHSRSSQRCPLESRRAFAAKHRTEPKGTVSVRAAELDRKPPSTSDESARILAPHPEPPIYLHQAVANSYSTTPRFAELPAIRH